MSETKCADQLSLFSVGKQQVTVDFQGGQIVTDAGLLPLAQLVEGLGILDDLARRFPDPRCQEMVTHGAKEILGQQIYQFLAGYFDFNDANATRHDPLFQALVGVSPTEQQPLASGSTVARFHHAYTRREADKPREERQVLGEQRQAQIQRIKLLNEYLIELFAKTRLEEPTHVILDLDGSEDAAYGQQQLTFWNAHYDQNQYYPLFVLDGASGFPLAAWLRPGHVHDSCGAVEILQEIVQQLRRYFPQLTIFVRGDGAFGGQEMLDFCDREGLLYAFGYRNHKGLKPQTGWLLEQLKLYYRFYPEERVQRFDEMTYQASTWSHPRRLLVKTEINILGTNQRLVVTNLSGSVQGLYQGFYAQRGNVPERPIGEMKNGLGSDRLSSGRFLANFQKLLSHVLAYAIVVLFREACRSEAESMATPVIDPEGDQSGSPQPAPVRVEVGNPDPVVVCRVPVIRVPLNQISNEKAAFAESAAGPASLEGSPATDQPVAVPPSATVEELLQASISQRDGSLLDVVRWEVSTLRSQLFKVGALVKTSVRRIWFHVSTHWPRRKLFAKVCQAITGYVEKIRHRQALATGPPE